VSLLHCSGQRESEKQQQLLQTQNFPLSKIFQIKHKEKIKKYQEHSCVLRSSKIFPDQTQTKSSNQHHIIKYHIIKQIQARVWANPLFINSDPNLQQSRPRIRTRFGTEEGNRAGFVLTRVDRTEEEQEKDRSFPFSQRFRRSRVEVTVFSLIHPFLLFFFFRNLHRRSRSFVWVFGENISGSIKRRRRGVGWYNFFWKK